MIILTGGAGFIGSNILEALTAMGRADVLIVDSLGHGEKWKNVAGSSFIDIVGKQRFREQLSSNSWGTVDAVIHMGACSTTTETDADYLLDNNYRYSIDVARFAFERNSRFIYASSAATYGDGSLGFDDTARDLAPLNMYGYSKHLFDEWIRKQGLEGACVGLKFFNVFGHHEYHKGDQSSMVLKAFKQVKTTGKIKLFKSHNASFADGEQVRDFLYVQDAVAVVMELLEKSAVNGIFNLGTGVGRTWNELATSVFDAMNVETNIEYVEMPSQLLSQYQYYTTAKMDRLLGALPSVRFQTLEAGVANYVREYLNK